MRQLQHFAALRRKPRPDALAGAPRGPAASPGGFVSAVTSAPALGPDRSGEAVDALEADMLSAVGEATETTGAVIAAMVAAQGAIDAGDVGTHDLVASVRDAGEQGAGVTLATQELAMASDQLAAVVALAARKLHEATASAEDAEALAAELARATEEIVGIADTLASVARQTNLLALNATIEAARAGPAGEEFLRVATGVKSLSVETAGAAGSIRARLLHLGDRAAASVRAAATAAAALHEAEPVLDTVHDAAGRQAAACADLAGTAVAASAAVERIGAMAEAAAARVKAAGIQVTKARGAGAEADAQVRDLGTRFASALRHSEVGDRRRHDRFPAHLDGMLHRHAGGGAHSLATRTLDLSAGGTLLARPPVVALTPGEAVELDIDRIGRMPARVVAVSARGLHCVFGDLDADVAARLARVLEAIEAEYRPLIMAAREAAAQVEGLLERAVADGRLTREELFDSAYRLVPDSDPPCYATAATPVLQELLPAVQERLLLSDGRMVFCVVVDRAGGTPAPYRAYVRALSGEDAWGTSDPDAEQRAALVAGRSSRPFVIQSFTGEGGGRGAAIREIDVPIRVFGRQWGGLRTGYRL